MMLLDYINKRPDKMLMVKQLDQNLINNTATTLIRKLKIDNKSIWEAWLLKYTGTSHHQQGIQVKKI